MLAQWKARQIRSGFVLWRRFWSILRRNDYAFLVASNPDHSVGMPSRFERQICIAEWLGERN